MSEHRSSQKLRWPCCACVLVLAAFVFLPPQGIMRRGETNGEETSWGGDYMERRRHEEGTTWGGDYRGEKNRGRGLHGEKTTRIRKKSNVSPVLTEAPEANAGLAFSILQRVWLRKKRKISRKSWTVTEAEHFEEIWTERR